MIPSVIFLAVLSGIASPLPTTTPQPPLKEIIHVKSSPLCTEFARHANNAIDSATRNDIALGSLIGSLRSGTLDGNVIAHNNAMNRLNDFADAITRDWKNGEKEVDEVRKLSMRATDVATKKELKDAADALGGALWRQRKVARDLDGFVAYLHARDMATVDSSQAAMNVSLFGVSDARDALRNGKLPEAGTDHDRTWLYSNPGLANEHDLPPMADQAAGAARDIESRIPEIVRDEISAAEHVSTASESC